jgi:PAS domain S-box-containing protein
MPIKLSLNMQKKGLLLVAVPLMFELVFIGVLFWLKRQADEAASQASHSKAVIVETENCMRAAYDAAGAFVLFSVAKSQSFGDRYEQVVVGLPAQLSELKKEIGNDRIQQKNYQLFEKEGNSAIKLMTHIKELIDNDETIGGKVQVALLRREITEQLNALMKASRSVIDEEERRSNLYPAAEESAKQMLAIAVVTGVLVSILLAVWLAIYFNRDYTQRVKKIVDNAIKLASGKELSQPIHGTDEIAELDEVLHIVAKQLLESSRRERAIVDNVQDAICTIGTKFTFLKVSPAASQLWGYTESELLGHRLSDLVAEEGKEKFFQILEAAKSTDPAVNIETRMARKDGTQVWVSWSAYWSGVEGAYFCVAHDIDQRKTLDQMKQDFVNMISHDLRSPMTSVAVFLHMVREGVYGLNEKGAAAAGRVESSVTGVVNLLNDLLDVEKLEAGKMQLRLESVKVSAIVEAALDIVRPLAEQQDIQLDLLRHEETIIVADSGRLSQVVQNIVSNALKFSPKGSFVQIYYGQNGGQAEIRVTDAGPGIPEGDREFVFDRFRQLDSQGEEKIKGSGLGLAICKAIVEQHGGTIGVISQAGQGSTFWFKIPSNSGVVAVGSNSA